MLILMRKCFPTVRRVDPSPAREHRPDLEANLVVAANQRAKIAVAAALDHYDQFPWQLEASLEAQEVRAEDDHLRVVARARLVMQAQLLRVEHLI